LLERLLIAGEHASDPLDVAGRLLGHAKT
jgi:hypothetical protein